MLGGGLRAAPLYCVGSQWRRGVSCKPPSSIIAFGAWVASTVLGCECFLYGTGHTHSLRTKREFICEVPWF
jgi:hypothetical protein